MYYRTSFKVGYVRLILEQWTALEATVVCTAQSINHGSDNITGSHLYLHVSLDSTVSRLKEKHSRRG